MRNGNPEPQAVIVEYTPEGDFDRLKKAVEDLGIVSVSDIAFVLAEA